jgi:hypothetical protein
LPHALVLKRRDDEFGAVHRMRSLRKSLTYQRSRILSPSATAFA